MQTSLCQYQNGWRPDTICPDRLLESRRHTEANAISITAEGVGRESSTKSKVSRFWLYHLASVWNRAVRKIELNARDKIYFSKLEFQTLLATVFSKTGRQTASERSTQPIHQHSFSRSHRDS